MNARSPFTAPVGTRAGVPARALARLLVVAAVGVGSAACHHIEASHNLCGGTTACAKAPCDPIEVLNSAPCRPYQVLGVVQVRVDRGTAFKNPTLADAMPALVEEARGMGADAIILTHEEFTSWYDKGEDASPIHDLEQQETWYITEKARYVSGVAVTYTGAAQPYATAPTRPAPYAAQPAMSYPTRTAPVASSASSASTGSMAYRVDPLTPTVTVTSSTSTPTTGAPVAPTPSKPEVRYYDSVQFEAGKPLPPPSRVR